MAFFSNLLSNFAGPMQSDSSLLDEFYAAAVFRVIGIKPSSWSNIPKWSMDHWQWKRGHTSFAETAREHGRLLKAVLEGRLGLAKPVFREDPRRLTGEHA